MNKNKMLVGLVIVLVLVVAVLGLKDKLFNKNGYSVVYLTSGEVYVGHLSTVNGFTLKDAYLLQSVKDTTDPSKSTFQLTSLKDAIWATEYLKLMKDQIVFYGPILKGGKIDETLKKAVK